MKCPRRASGPEDCSKDVAGRQRAPVAEYVVCAWNDTRSVGGVTEPGRDPYD